MSRIYSTAAQMEIPYFVPGRLRNVEARLLQDQDPAGRALQYTCGSPSSVDEGPFNCTGNPALVPYHFSEKDLPEHNLRGCVPLPDDIIQFMRGLAQEFQTFGVEMVQSDQQAGITIRMCDAIGTGLDTKANAHLPRQGYHGRINLLTSFYRPLHTIGKSTIVHESLHAIPGMTHTNIGASVMARNSQIPLDACFPIGHRMPDLPAKMPDGQLTHFLFPYDRAVLEYKFLGGPQPIESNYANQCPPIDVMSPLELYGPQAAASFALALTSGCMSEYLEKKVSNKYYRTALQTLGCALVFTATMGIIGSLDMPEYRKDELYLQTLPGGATRELLSTVHMLREHQFRLDSILLMSMFHACGSFFSGLLHAEETYDHNISHPMAHLLIASAASAVTTGLGITLGRHFMKRRLSTRIEHDLEPVASIPPHNVVTPAQDISPTESPAPITEAHTDSQRYMAYRSSSATSMVARHRTVSTSDRPSALRVLHNL